jgi:hypothetical protein
VRQELTSNQVTGWLGKPHPEQDQIGGDKGCLSYSPGWSLDLDGNGKARWMVTAPLMRSYRNRLIDLLGTQKEIYYCHE